MSHKVGVVAYRRLFQHLVLVMALFITLALGMEVSDGKRAKGLRKRTTTFVVYFRDTLLGPPMPCHPMVPPTLLHPSLYRTHIHSPGRCCHQITCPGIVEGLSRRGGPFWPQSLCLPLVRSQRVRREKKRKTRMNHNQGRGSLSSHTSRASHFLGTLVIPYPWSHLVLLLSSPNPVLHWLSSLWVLSLASSYPTLPALVDLVDFLPLPAGLVSFIVDLLIGGFLHSPNPWIHPDRCTSLGEGRCSCRLDGLL